MRKSVSGEGPFGISSSTEGAIIRTEKITAAYYTNCRHEIHSSFFSRLAVLHVPFSFWEHFRCRATPTMFIMESASSWYMTYAILR